MARMRLDTWQPARLRRVRRLRGWGVDELAQRAGIEPGSVRYYEGDRATPQPPALTRLAGALGVATVDLAPLRCQPTLHELRWHAGFSSADLAARVGLSRTALSEQLRCRARITCPEAWAAALSTPAVPVTPELIASAWQTSRAATGHRGPLAAAMSAPAAVSPPAPRRPAGQRASDAREADGSRIAAILDEDPDDTELNSDITTALADLDAAEQRLLDVVSAARSGGRSLDDIGKILGVTRQAAWQRFARRTSISAAGALAAGPLLLRSKAGGTS